jgi:hypothetical protein
MARRTIVAIRDNLLIVDMIIMSVFTEICKKKLSSRQAVETGRHNNPMPPAGQNADGGTIYVVPKGAALKGIWKRTTPLTVASISK